jgi:phosphate:Na+ symporter
MWKIILDALPSLLGGLALFIFGMNYMGEGIKKAAGEKLRHILKILTTNPFVGMLMGMLVTAIIQSSAATTVMVVGFISAGLMGAC